MDHTRPGGQRHRTTSGDARQLVLSALAGLESAGVVYCLRNGELSTPLGGHDDIDVLVAPQALALAVSTLRTQGWFKWRAPGHPGHEFVLRCASDGTWVKIDLVTRLRYGKEEVSIHDVLARRTSPGGPWTVAPEDAAAHRRRRQAGLREPVELRTRWRRALPTSWLRSAGLVVALVGPDGAGKGTVLEDLRRSLPVATSAVYLGDRRAGARPNLVPAQSGSTVADDFQREAGRTSRLRESREVLFVLRKNLRLLPTAGRIVVAAARGHVVLCDRHPLDAVAVRPRRAPHAARFEQFLVRRVIPRPHLLVVLDAPGASLHARKGEHDVATLDRWRRGYLGLPGGHVVDTSGAVEDSTAAVRRLLWEFATVRRSGGPETSEPRQGSR